MNGEFPAFPSMASLVGCPLGWVGLPVGARGGAKGEGGGGMQGGREGLSIAKGAVRGVKGRRV